MPRSQGRSTIADDGVPVIGGSPLLGAARDLRRDLLGTFDRAMHDHGGGPVRFRVGPPKIGFLAEAIFEPEGARQVLATDAANYDKNVPALKEFRRFVGDGLLTSDGDRWRRDRRIVAPLFTRKRIGTFVEAMVGSAERLVSSWASVAAEGGSVDVCEPSMVYALEVLGTTVFGEDVQSAEAIIRSSVPVLNERVTRTALSPVRLPSWLPTPANRRAERARRAVWDFVETLIARRRAAAATGPVSASPSAASGGDLLSLLLTAEDPDTGARLDDVAVRDQALIFLLAGHETTGATLAFALHLLGRHPDVQQRVRDEVRRVAANRCIEAGDIALLSHTSHVIQETMRLYPAGHTLVRRSREASAFGAHRIPAKRIVAISVWAIHHNPSVWPDPYRFDPDRFSPREGPADDGNEQPQVSRYAHLPFGGGPRGCIGQYLAMAEMIVAVATIVRAFELESLVESPKLDVGVSLLPAGALACRLRHL
ncbi:MAG TPA: cytochrome P450 [Acidimicrobiales bacterium]|nr:cytochrome P450 [Acidimicrobiales bacterium]